MALVGARPSLSVAQLAAILDHVPDALLLVDGFGRVVSANARAVAAFHADVDGNIGAGKPSTASAGSLVGAPLSRVLPGFGWGRGPTTRYAAQRRPAFERMVARSRDGSSFAVDVFHTVLSWDDGSELLLVVLRLVGDPSQAEAELRRTQQQTEAVLRAAEEAVCGTDADGRLVLANPAASRLLGLRASEAAGRDLHAMALHTHADGSPYPAESSPLFDTLRWGRPHRRRREVMWRADGTPVPVQLSTVAIREGAEVVGAVATFTDASREVDLERRRERLVAVLDEDLRSQLSSLREEIRRRRADASTEAAGRLLEHVSRAAERLLRTVDEMVDREPPARPTPRRILWTWASCRRSPTGTEGACPSNWPPDAARSTRSSSPRHPRSSGPAGTHRMARRLPTGRSWSGRRRTRRCRLRSSHIAAHPSRCTRCATSHRPAASRPRSWSTR